MEEDSDMPNLVEHCDSLFNLPKSQKLNNLTLFKYPLPVTNAHQQSIKNFNDNEPGDSEDEGFLFLDS